MKKRMVEYKNIGAYIAAQPTMVKPTLAVFRRTLKKAVPGAEEGISYGMPAFKSHGIVMYFAAFKKHCSFFARPVHLQPFREELKAYTTTKSAVHIPLQGPVPVKLVSKIAKYAAAQNRADKKSKA